MKKKILAALLIGALAVGLTACTEVDKVSYNVSQEADNFNALRRFAVINTRTDKVEFELIGAFSLQVENAPISSRLLLSRQTDLTRNISLV